MKVDMRVQCRAEAVQEAHRAEPSPEPGIGTVRSQRRLDDAQKEVQHRIHGGRFALQEVVRALRNRQDPLLAHRQPREDVVDPMRGGLGHAPRMTRRANRPCTAGEGHQEVVTAARASGTSETPGEDATSSWCASHGGGPIYHG
jgi:hypothetical protein